MKVDDNYKFPAIAGVHEQTVQTAEEHAARNAQPRRRRQPSTPRCGRIETFQVDKSVMAMALRIARGDSRRLQINKDGSVIVR
jgi:hypothetical protein